MPNGGDANVSVFPRIGVGKMTLMGISHPFAIWAERVSPNERFAGLAAACRELPFRFGWQALASPIRVGHGIFVSDLHHGIIFFALNIGPWPSGMSPVSPFHVSPPLKMVIERHRMIWRGKDDATSNKIFRKSARIILGARSALRHSNVSCGPNELSELSVGNICFVHIETVDVDAMNRARICRGMHAVFVHIRGFVRPHGKLATGNPHHALRGRPWCGVAILLGQLE